MRTSSPTVSIARKPVFAQPSAVCLEVVGPNGEHLDAYESGFCAHTSDVEGSVREALRSAMWAAMGHHGAAGGRAGRAFVTDSDGRVRFLADPYTEKLSRVEDQERETLALTRVLNTYA